MADSPAAGWTTALVTGVAFAVSAALILRAFPGDFFTDPAKRILMFALSALAAPPIVASVRWLARKFRRDQSRFLYVANTGAVMFDSAVTGFAPGFYGHTGEASRVVLAVIVFGLAAIFLVDQFVPPSNQETR